MAIDKEGRKKLERLVSEGRRLLEAEYGAQLQAAYGIGLDGSVAASATLGHLSEAELKKARALREELLHFSSGKAEKRETAQGVERLLRELSFTTLNRLAALKLCESREFLIESVSSGYSSRGFEIYSRLAGPALGDTYARYSMYLESVFDELSLDLGALFDRRAPGALLFPRESALLGLLELLNDPALVPFWSEDETIGWMYQYFNSKEERREMRSDSGGAPRNSRELAVRNQFFTPRYVVEFLCDNSIGRLWYEMSRGETIIARRSRYLVEPKDRLFLSRMTDPEDSAASPAIVDMGRILASGKVLEWPDFREGHEGDAHRLINFAHSFDGYVRHSHEDSGPLGAGCWLAEREGKWATAELGAESAEDLSDFLFLAVRAGRWGGGVAEDERGRIASTFIRNPSAVRAANELLRRLRNTDEARRPAIHTYRRPKDPREIRMLDPACGSMHFGLYAFDLFEAIYREAWDGYPELFADLRASGMSRDELLRQAPALIIENNLHGIDIDRRCAQIASLSLWLRAQKSWKEAGITAEDRPRIRKSNIACAEPMPGEAPFLEEYAASLAPKVLGDLVKDIWKEMRLAGEAGSLLKIEERIEGEVKRARAAWRVWTIDMKKQSYAQGDFFSKGHQLSLKDTLGYEIRDIEGAEEWEGMEARLLEALRRYAEAAQAEGGTGKRLFADDAAAGFSFIDLCRKRYDAVLMNPPFGESAAGAKQYIGDEYPRTKNDLAAAFVEMALRRLQPHGYAGAITTRTIFFLSSHTKFREEIMLKEARPTVFADLGFGVLDAMVETAAYVVEKA